MKNIFLFIIVILFLTQEEASFAFDKNLPSSVIDQIYKDYSTKTAYIVAGSKKESDLIIEIQNDQTFKFRVFKKEYAIVPFTYVPIEPGRSRKCVIRILTIPKYCFLQDLCEFMDDDDELPCNGIVALSFKDINSDKANDIIALYDFFISGNKSIEPEVAVYVYKPSSKKFVFNQTLSFKATGIGVRNMKDALNNLKRKR